MLYIHCDIKYSGIVSAMVPVYIFQVFVHKLKKGGRWAQTFLVVKGRNLQLSNKSLRLDPRCHWLPLTTWRTLYEHELYAVVYSLVLPLYQQQSKLGRRKSPLFSLLLSNSSICAWSACSPGAVSDRLKSRDPRLPDLWELPRGHTPPKNQPLARVHPPSEA